MNDTPHLRLFRTFLKWGYHLQNAAHFMLVERIAKKTLSLKSFRVSEVQEGVEGLEILIVPNRRSLPVCSCCGRKRPIRDTLHPRRWRHVKRKQCANYGSIKAGKKQNCSWKNGSGGQRIRGLNRWETWLGRWKSIKRKYLTGSITRWITGWPKDSTEKQKRLCEEPMATEPSIHSASRSSITSENSQNPIIQPTDSYEEPYKIKG